MVVLGVLDGKETSFFDLGNILGRCILKLFEYWWVVLFLSFVFLHFSHDEDEIRPVQQQDLHRAIEKMKKSKDAAFQNVLTHVCLD